MEKAEDYVDSQNLNKSIMTEKGARIDKKLFDKESFKQAWYNACLHNLWIEGVPPAVYIFSDRIQVLSNGGLPANLMFDDFYKGTSRPVNEELARIFLSLELMEQTGYGIPIIVKKYSKKAFDFSPNTIRVDLMFNEEVLEAERAWKEKILSSHDTKNDTKNDTKHNTNTLEKELINLIQHNQNITQAQIIENLKISRSTLVRYLRLSKKIKRVGSKTNGHWEIINN
jgi:predicted HTH transcriptional regulator